MLVKIPLKYYQSKPVDIDYESLGLPIPQESIDEYYQHDTYVDPKEIVWIEPNLDGEGCYIHVRGFEREWLCAMDIDELAKLVNETTK